MDWVCRAMAELATMGNAIVIRLSYADGDDGQTPDGAKTFRYKDVQGFLARLRKAYSDKYGKTGEISYLVAGERGSKRGRVHYHMILFSVRPLDVLGEWSSFVGKKLDAPWMDSNIHWSLWPHGSVYLQVPDAGGVSYVLKYALKDQFSVQKSKGTKRFSKAENTAAGIFRMSKKPPLGLRFVEAQLARWSDLRAVPPSLTISVPGIRGYWHPLGLIREALLSGLHRINNEIREETGRDAPQWSTLLAGVSQDLESNLTDFEALVYGPLEISQLSEEQHEQEFQKFTAQFETGQAARERAARIRDTRRTCGGVRVCAACYRGFDTAQRLELAAWQARTRRDHENSRSPLELDAWFRAFHKGNPYCLTKDGPAFRKAFDA